MSFISSLSTIGLLLAAMVALSLVEALIPLHPRGEWGRRHLGPNVMLTLLTFATNLVFNIPLLLGLAWLQSRGLGLFNAFPVPPPVKIAGSVLALDLAWYLTHVSMHHVPILWRFHAVHHSDPAVDVTTAVRQHPGESVIRYAYLTAVAFAIGAPPAGFAAYRIWSALHGQFEHANLRLPGWLDTAITVAFSSPNMHKIHHSRDASLTNRNYTNIFSIWDRLFGTFVPARRGGDVAYGLEGCDAAREQTTVGLLGSPFRSAGRVR
jgi:sterol desaturase/sphingolipid hydroxylase (fatty acid hydroxylase superfamily)